MTSNSTGWWPSDAEPLVTLGLALGIGMLIGLERGWAQRARGDGERVAGVRTFAVYGFAGGVIGLLSATEVFMAALAAGLAMTLLPVAAYFADARLSVQKRSITNAAVLVLTLLLGMTAAAGFRREAVIAATVTMALLASRERLHRWLRSLSDEDVRLSVQFAVIALVVLPLLPNVDFGPFNAFNLQKLWLVVVFIAGISFAGYWASRSFGAARGTIVAAAIGASYSSTAVTAELARRLRASAEAGAVLRAGIAAATAVMLLRVMLLTTVLAPSIAADFALLVAPAALVAMGVAFVMIRRADAGQGAPLATTNPFALAPAIGFAVLVGVVLLAARWAIARFGDDGLGVLLALTGLYDVDAAIIIVGNLGPVAMTSRSLAAMLLVPVVVNTLLKAGIAMTLAGRGQAIRAAAPLLAAALVLIASYSARLLLD